MNATSSPFDEHGRFLGVPALAIGAQVRVKSACSSSLDIFGHVAELNDGIVMVRIFLESFSSPDVTGYMLPFNGIYLHLPLFYFAVFLSFSLVLFLLTNKNISNIFYFLLPIHLLILLPPSIDLFLSGGMGYPMSYTTLKWQQLPTFFLKMATSFTVPGVTPGMYPCFASTYVCAYVGAHCEAVGLILSFN